MKDGVHFDWNDKCQQAFDGLKSYLSFSPILKPLIPEKSLILYVPIIDDSVGAVLAQHDEEGKERATYYLSKLFNDTEKKYTIMKKACAGVVWVA